MTTVALAKVVAAKIKSLHIRNCSEHGLFRSAADRSLPDRPLEAGKGGFREVAVAEVGWVPAVDRPHVVERGLAAFQVGDERRVPVHVADAGRIRLGEAAVRHQPLVDGAGRCEPHATH